MKIRTLAIAGGVLLAGAGLAVAQLSAVTAVTLTHPADMVQVIPNGVASPTNAYATLPAINGAPGYVNGGAVSTAWTYTFAHNETSYLIQPAGTLATGTWTTEANPQDGQRECLLSTQTQTALTMTANTGQTIANAATAGVANTPICITYQASNATWYRSP